MADKPIITKSPRFVDLTGRQCGLWRVVSHSHYASKSHWWHCDCECGTKRVVNGNNLRKGISTNCGCVRSAKVREHGKARRLPEGTRRRDEALYGVWLGIRQRCVNENCAAYLYYGAKARTMCSRWYDGEGGVDGYLLFKEDMGPRPEGMTVERIANSLGYSPDNCRWATRKEQAANTDHNVIVNFRGQDMILIEAIRASGLTQWTVRKRTQRGWSLEKALNTPQLRKRKATT